MFSRMNHLPVMAIPELPKWAAQSLQITQQPLEFCKDFPLIARRFEAWWAQEMIDRPIFAATANTKPSRPITRRLDLLKDPNAWFDAKMADLRQTYRVGDALPMLRADFGPVLLGGLLGGTLEFGADTAWTHAFIQDDWANAPDWVLRDDNAWWRLLRTLTERAACEASGRYLVCTPDLGGSGDVLLNLRGAQGLCLDVLTQPDRVRSALDAIYPAWRLAFSELYRIALSHNAGLVHWLGLWSDCPYIVPACDFNYLIGNREFNDIFLPDIARQAATVGRAVFHLDGPGATKHVEALLDLPEIRAIQFTPGEGTPSALAWVDMFRRIQDRRRALFIVCPAREVIALCEALRPEGLGLWVLDAGAPATLDALFDRFCRCY